MIDPSLPLELDDGTPCELVNCTRYGSYTVRHTSSPTRPGCSALEDTWLRPDPHRGWYYSKEGIFGGGSARNQFVLRNVIPTGPEPYEAWFK